MSDSLIIGLIDFKYTLLVDIDVLGKEIPISIGGINGVIIFPSLPNEKNNLKPYGNTNYIKLDPPILAKGIMQGDSTIYWGHSYNNSNNIFKALFKFNIFNTHIEKDSQSIYNGFNEWIKLFYKYIKLFTLHNTIAYVEHDNIYINDLRIFDMSEDFKKISRSSAEEFTIIVNTEEKNLNFQILNHVCEISSLGIKPKLEYVLLLEAYEAMKEIDYRKAIIEASSALEISLTNRIRKEFRDSNINYGDKLLKKYRMLGGLFELSKIMEIDLPTSDYQKLIINPRNEVIHKANFSNRIIANKCISEVEKYLKKFSPIFNEDKE